MKTVNKPRVSKSILRFYQGLTAFIAFLSLYSAYTAFFTPAGIAMLGASFILLVLIMPLFIMVLRSINNTKYILLDKELLIDTSSIIGGNKRIPFEEIESVERTLIPIGLRWWGASLHGGHYLIPGLGKAFMTITNMSDGVLIRTQSMNYIISPSEPDGFIDSLKSRITVLA